MPNAYDPGHDFSDVATAFERRRLNQLEYQIETCAKQLKEARTERSTLRNKLMKRRWVAKQKASHD